MGRHRADNEDKQQANTRRQVREQRVGRQPVLRGKNHDLLLWGIFLAVTAVGTMTWAEIDWRVTGAVSFLLLLSFTAAWQFSPAPAAAHAAEQAPDPTPAAKSQPAAARMQAGPAAVARPESVPEAAAPAGSGAGPAPNPPITRKEMRAADPTTGVLPVVSVFARKPGGTSGHPSARTVPSNRTVPSAAVKERGTATASSIPLAPAGQVLQGIDTGQAKPDSRKARRRAEALKAAPSVPSAAAEPEFADRGRQIPSSL